MSFSLLQRPRASIPAISLEDLRQYAEGPTGSMLRANPYPIIVRKQN
jgi:hypothetical protein